MEIADQINRAQQERKNSQIEREIWWEEWSSKLSYSDDDSDCTEDDEISETGVRKRLSVHHQEQDSTSNSHKGWIRGDHN